MNIVSIEGICNGFCENCPHLLENPSIDVIYCQRANTLQKMARIEGMLSKMAVNNSLEDQEKIYVSDIPNAEGNSEGN